MNAEPTKPQGMAVASMILGIVGIVVSITPCTFFLGLVCDVLAIVLGYFATKNVAAGNASGGQFAKIGMWTGGIGCVLFMLAWLVIGAAVSSGQRDFERKMDEAQRDFERAMDRIR
jgi:hypothetical protein